MIDFQFDSSTVSASKKRAMRFLRQELEKSKHELAVLQQELMLTKTFSGIKGNGVRSVKLS